MTTHSLKTWPEYFQAVVDGTKTFEARKDDRGFRVGDTVVLREWSPVGGLYSGREVRAVITYILRGTEHVIPGYCVLALGRVT